MKRIIAIAALAALAACSKPAEEPAAPAEATAEATAEAAPTAATAATAAAAAMAADGKPTVGKYKITRADGSVMMEDLRADGTFVSTSADGKTETGKWEQKGPNLYCATEDKEGAKQLCFDEKVDDKGVYTSKHPETGEVSTVVRVES